MPVYQPRGVKVEVLDNPNFINVGDDVRLPALVGLGPTSIKVIDEAVVRGATSVDTLSVSTANIASIQQIANTPGIASGSVSARAISENGALYSLASASITNPGQITWTGSGDNVPNEGDVYYISYTYDVLSTQFDPKTFSDKAALKSTYGDEDVTDGLLTIGGAIVLENGSPAVMCVQASGSSYVEANYKAAIDKLQKKNNIEQLVILFPSGSVTRTQQESLINYAITHVKTMTNNGKERGLMTGSPSSYFASDGIDTIGDESTSGTYRYRAAALADRDVTYIVPSRIRRKDESGNYMELDGNFAAAAVAGVQAAQDKQATPIHGFNVVGIEIENEKWNDFEMNQLGGSGCLVLESRSNVITIRDAITTDSTSADTQEISVVSTQRLVKRTLRDALTNTYTNKGKVITNTTTNDVEATTFSTLQSLVLANEIAAIGREDNPATGETKISAKRDTTEPRRILVTCSYQPLYPLKWITVTVSVFI